MKKISKVLSNYDKWNRQYFIDKVLPNILKEGRACFQITENKDTMCKILDELNLCYCEITGDIGEIYLDVKFDDFVKSEYDKKEKSLKETHKEKIKSILGSK